MKKLLLLVCFIFSFQITYAHSEIKQIDYIKSESKYPLGSEKNPIKVGLMLVVPFVEKNGDEYSGLLIDYWRHIVKSKDWHYVFIETSPNYTQALKDAAKGKYDLILGNFSTTAERIAYIKYSRPYMLNKITILTTSATVKPLTILIKLCYAIIEILLTIIVIIGIVSLFLRMFRSKEDNTTLKEFFIIAFINLLGAVTETRFKTAMIIMLLVVGLIIKAIFFAGVTSTLFNLSLANRDPFLTTKDVSGKLFLVVKGSSFVDKMRSLNARVYEFDGGDEEAAEFYAKNSSKFAGYVSDYAPSYRYANEYKNIEPNLMVSSLNVRNDVLAFVYNDFFPFGKIIDKDILELQDSNLAFSICSVYIGEEATSCLM